MLVAGSLTGVEAAELSHGFRLKFIKFCYAARISQRKSSQTAQTFRAQPKGAQFSELFEL